MIPRKPYNIGCLDKSVRICVILVKIHRIVSGLSKVCKIQYVYVVIRSYAVFGSEYDVGPGWKVPIRSMCRTLGCRYLWNTSYCGGSRERSLCRRERSTPGCWGWLIWLTRMQNNQSSDKCQQGGGTRLTVPNSASLCPQLFPFMSIITYWCQKPHPFLTYCLRTGMHSDGPINQLTNRYLEWAAAFIPGENPDTAIWVYKSWKAAKQSRRIRRTVSLFARHFASLLWSKGN